MTTYVESRYVDSRYTATTVVSPTYVDSRYVESRYTATGQPSAVVGLCSAPSPLGAPELTGLRPAGGYAAAPGPLASPSVVGRQVVAGRIAATSLLGAPSGVGVAISRGSVLVPSPLSAARGMGVVVTTGRSASPSPLGAPKLSGTVLRFELRVEVRDQGVLINRRVRAHRRDNGAMVGDVDTVGGRVVIPAGFAPTEYYLVPINLDPDATDFAPPCANRVVSVLAMDVPT